MKAADATITLDVGEVDKLAEATQAIRESGAPDDPYYGTPSPESFEEDDGSKASFLPADDLESMAEGLIEAHPEVFSALNGAKINYLWKRTGGKAGGHAVFGKAVALPEIAKYLADMDRDTFAIWLAADNCQDYALTADQVKACLAHQLMHIFYDPDKDQYKLTGHDFEGFGTEVRLFGAWNGDLRMVGRQMSFLDKVPVEEKPEDGGA